VGAAIVGVFSYAQHTLGWQVSLLVLPVVYVIYRSYRLYLNQLESEREQAEKERKHAQEVALLQARTMDALASAMAANAKLDAVIQGSPLAILALDADRNVTSWNKMAERVLGWSPEAFVGRPLPFSEERSVDVLEDIVNRTFRGDLIEGVEVTQWRKDGSPFDTAIWTAPLRDGNGCVSGVLITIADVSERRRLEEQLRLSQKMEAVGRLAGGIAHDFNNLLTVINGYSGMLVDSLRNNPHASSQAAEILGAGTRAAELIAQLLAFSRRQMIKPRPFEINQLVRDVERMLRRVIGEHIELRTVLNPETGWTRADLNQMEAVILNLATNAQDAMPKGGVLSIETSRVEVAANGPRPEPDLAAGSYVQLVVRDTGHGMDAETQRHLFEPFFTTKQKGKGTGLGLSTVYGSIEQNKGRIFVASKPGNGATFSVYLPRIEPPSSVQLTPTMSEISYEGTETVLLVEDEDAVRRMLREALTKSGYRIWEAVNGFDAIRTWGAQVNQINLLVTDIVMPVMNGLKLAEELRDRRPALKVIFMSGHAEELISRQSDSDQAPDVLTKPFTPEVLVRKVREVLDGSANRIRVLSIPEPHTSPSTTKPGRN
jgi:PAS domain S-box-containing protein